MFSSSRIKRAIEGRKDKNGDVLYDLKKKNYSALHDASY